MSEQNLHVWILLKDKYTRYDQAGKTAINEAVLNGVLFRPDGAPMSNTCRQIVQWLASVKSFAWSVNGGINHRMSWWMTRMGMDVSRADFERALKELRESQVITVVTTQMPGGRVPMTTYSLSPEFRRYCTGYLQFYVRRAKNPSGKDGLAATHRRYEKGGMIMALRNIVSMFEARSEEKEPPSV